MKLVDSTPTLEMSKKYAALDNNSEGTKKWTEQKKHKSKNRIKGSNLQKHQDLPSAKPNPTTKRKGNLFYIKTRTTKSYTTNLVDGLGETALLPDQATFY